MNAGEIHAWLLRVVESERGIFPANLSASFCFGNTRLTAMTHSSLSRTEGKQTRVSFWSHFTPNRARILNTLPVALCGAVNSSTQIQVTAKVDLHHRGHSSMLYLFRSPSTLNCTLLYSVSGNSSFRNWVKGSQNTLYSVQEKLVINRASHVELRALQ